MIDAETVVQTALSGVIPPTWQVLRARRAYVIAFQVVPVLVVAVAVSASILLRVLLARQSGAVGLIGNIIFAVAALILGALVVALYVRERDALNRRMIVLMPEGFVAYLGGPPDTALAVSYAAPLLIRRSGVRRSQSLVVHDAHGEEKPWRPSAEFGSPDEIIRRIILAREAYQEQLSEGHAPDVPPRAS
jgi:hypothetical protein